jgi:hypothetical protein
VKAGRGARADGVGGPDEWPKDFHNIGLETMFCYCAGSHADVECYR